MIGTITHILAKAGYKAMNGPLADERRRLAGAVPPAAYVSYDPRLLAGVGWYGYRIALKGGDRSMLERARYMLEQQYVIRDSYEYYADGIYTFGVLLRQRVKLYGIGGGANPGPSPDDFWGLKLKMPEGGTVILRKNGSPNAVSLEVSTDGTNWQPWELVGTDYSYTLQAGQTLCIRNTSTTFVQLSTGTTKYYGFVFDRTVEASGSVMSLSVNDETVLSLAGDNFNFFNLFRNCVSLAIAPELPATTLASSCYGSMFRGCTSLTTAPELPATTLASNCYQNMFYGCTSLTILPSELPAMTLTGNCYSSMFYGCTSLTIAPESPATTLTSNCYNSMFYGCTSLTSAPELPATTLVNSCYYQMFQGCTILSEIRTHMTDISASTCLNNWLSTVAATGDFYCPSSLTIPSGASGIPNGWTRHDI